MTNNSLLEIPIVPISKGDTLEKIIKYIHQPAEFFHIVSLNPEIVVLASKDSNFRKVLQEAQISIVDGMGVSMACLFLGIPKGERVVGVDLMQDLLKLAHDSRLRVMLIGGNAKIAETVADCQKELFPGINIMALQGISSIASPTKGEEKHILSIVADYKPHMIFASFGSPYQELWLYKHKDRLDNIICMGVGGAFDFLSGSVPRAPRIIRKMGFEWLFRLIVQPWRIKRQFRLIEFIWIVVKAKFNNK